MTYSEKLRDPRWQKKRLEILERAAWKCECCGNESAELQVHHLAYGAEPWDVSDEQLECLCCHCHEKREYVNARLREIVLSFKTANALLLGYEVDQFAEEHPTSELTKVFAEAIQVSRLGKKTLPAEVMSMAMRAIGEP